MIEREFPVFPGKGRIINPNSGDYHNVALRYSAGSGACKKWERVSRMKLWHEQTECMRANIVKPRRET